MPLGILKTALSAFCHGLRHDWEVAVLFATVCPRFSRAERVAISLKGERDCDGDHPRLAPGIC